MLEKLEMISLLCLLELTLISSNYLCLEHLFVVSKVFEPLTSGCTEHRVSSENYIPVCKINNSNLRVLTDAEGILSTRIVIIAP